MPMWRRWSESDMARLKSMAMQKPTAQIAAELGRGVPATIMKAHELRVSLRLKPKRGSRATPDLGPISSKTP